MKIVRVRAGNESRAAVAASRSSLPDQDAMGVEVLVRMAIGVERDVGVGLTNGAPPRPIRQHAGRRLEYIAAQMLHGLGAVAGDDPREHFLHQIVDIGRLAYPPTEVTRKRSPQRLGVRARAPGFGPWLHPGPA